MTGKQPVIGHFDPGVLLLRVAQAAAARLTQLSLNLLQPGADILIGVVEPQNLQVVRLRRRQIFCFLGQPT